MIDWDAARFSLDVLALAFAGGAALYTWVSNRRTATKAAIDRVDERVSRTEERVSAVENDVRHLPSHEDLGHLHEKVNEVGLSVNRLGGELEGMNRTLSLIHQSLLQERNQ